MAIACLSGRLSVAFRPESIQLRSRLVLDADVLITATGFNLSVLGDIRFQVAGQPLNFADTIAWRGAMFTGLPNMAWVFGTSARVGRCAPTW